MNASDTSQHLLAHFDRVNEHTVSRAQNAPQRGIAWVITWAIAFVVIAFAGCQLLQVIYIAGMERALLNAARAGTVEATLPQSSRESIAEVISHRLRRYELPIDQRRVTIRKNGLPAKQALGLAERDRISVTIATPASAVLPAWLRVIGPQKDENWIEVTAEREMPGKRLPIRVFD